jgi:predicted PurR-regulated permease PerM
LDQLDQRPRRSFADWFRQHATLSWALRWGTVAWALIGLIILTAVVVWAFSKVQDIFPPLVLALVVIYVLNPVVTRAERVGVPRLAGSCLAFAILFAVVAVALLFAVPALAQQAEAFVRDLPRTIANVQRLSESVGDALSERLGRDFSLTERFDADLIRQALGSIGGFLRGAAHTVALLVIGLIAGFYLLIDLPRLQRGVLRLMPPDRREEAQEVAGSVGRAMGGFFRGQLFVALIVGVMSALALRIVGIPYWLVVGLVAGFFNLIPLIGPYVGAIPGILIAGAYGPPIRMLWVAVALTIVQQIDNHLISPNVMRLTVRLHPVTVIFSLIVGATLMGFWGMLLAVPTVASIKVVASHIWRTRVPWGHEVFEDGEAREVTALGPEPQESDPVTSPAAGVAEPAADAPEETPHVTG